MDDPKIREVKINPIKHALNIALYKLIKFLNPEIIEICVKQRKLRKG